MVLLRRAGPAGLALLFLSGCNTTAGFGRDVETAGIALQREAAQATQPEPRPAVITPDPYTYVPPR